MIPKIYQNKNIKIDDNTQSIYSSANKKEVVDINEKISNIFKSNKHLYKIPVIIDTYNQKHDTFLIGKTNNYLITFDNKLILIKDIQDINEKN